jgi:enamine deaminase RidA (YjgF/YER057c/UK114 family)
MNRPRSPYFQVAHVQSGEIAFIAGQVAVNEAGQLVGEDDFEAQCAAVFDNIHKALRSIGADWGNVVEFTSYLTRREDVRTFTDFRNRMYPAMFGGNIYPPNTLLLISGLANPKYLLEVQSVAAI